MNENVVDQHFHLPRNILARIFVVLFVKNRSISVSCLGVY